MPGVKAPRGACRAHHLEWRYLEALRRNREGTRAKPKRLQPCGTSGAYKRHRDRGEPICEACRVAENARNKARREQRTAAQRARRARQALTRAA